MVIHITKTQIGKTRIVLLRRDLRLKKVQRHVSEKAFSSYAILEMAVFSTGQGGSEWQSGDVLQPGLQIKKSVFRACNSSKSIFQANASSPNFPSPMSLLPETKSRKSTRRIFRMPFAGLV